MFEILKILWDVFVLRDAVRKGQMNWRIWAIAISFVLFLYGTALPVTLLYEKKPEYKPLFIATLALDGLIFVWFMTWGVRRYLRQLSARKPVGDIRD
jgi:hypothetical protein